MLMNIFSKVIPSKIVTFPKVLPRMNDCKKTKLENEIYKLYVKQMVIPSKTSRHKNTKNQIINKRKNDYNHQFALKVSNPKTRLKTFWSILKTFYNRKKYHLFLPCFYSVTLVFQ